jgi:hypothetical protein
MRNLKTLVGVAPLTILVWVYAEQQELVNETSRVRVVVQSADPAHRAVTLTSPSDGIIQLTLQGSQIGIDRVKALLQQTVLAKPIEIEVATALPAGPQQPVACLDAIAANPIFFRQGVTVTQCNPETLIVRIDALEDRLATVVAPPDAPGLIQANFHPATVVMRGPSYMFPRGRLSATADMTDLTILKTPGKHDGVLLPLVPLDNFTFLPDSVTADLTVGQADESISVSPVSVLVLAPKYLTDGYRFDYKEVLPQPVTLTGPPQSIALIDPHNPKLIGVVELDNFDAGHQVTKPVTFEDRGLPDGVHVKPDASPPTIQINVELR